MAGLALAASAIGTVVSAVGTVAAGQARRKQADFQAAQLDVKAKEERAAAGLEAQEIQRATRLKLSTLQARAAASGFGAADPTVLDLAGGIAERGGLAAGITRYGGNSRGRAYNAQAEGERISGRAAETASYWGAASTVIGGFGSMFARYGQSFMPSSPVNDLWGNGGGVSYAYTANHAYPNRGGY